MHHTPIRQAPALYPIPVALGQPLVVRLPVFRAPITLEKQALMVETRFRFANDQGLHYKALTNTTPRCINHLRTLHCLKLIDFSLNSESRVSVMT